MFGLLKGRDQGPARPAPRTEEEHASGMDRDDDTDAEFNSMADCLAFLRVAKQAMQEDLITQADFDVLKVAFLKAQQIKAGLDAGFITKEDYDKARDAFLSAVQFGAAPTPAAEYAPRPPPQAAAAPAAAAARPHATTRPASGPGSAVSSKPPSREGSGSLATVGSHPLPEPAIAELNGSAGTSVSAPAAAAVAAAGAATAVAAAAVAAAPARPAAAKAAPASRTTVALPADLPDTCRGATAGKKSMSGIAVSEEAVNMFNYMKTRSSNKWITFRVDGSGSTVVIDALGGKASTWDDFLANFSEAECKYGVFDYVYRSPERGTFNKLVFVNWAPDSAPTRVKMMYASTKDFFKGFLDGVGADLQACDSSELSEDAMAAKVVGNMTRK